MRLHCAQRARAAHASHALGRKAQRLSRFLDGEQRRQRVVDILEPRGKCSDASCLHAHCITQRGDANLRLRRLSREIAPTRTYLVRYISRELVPAGALDRARNVLQRMGLGFLSADEALYQLAVQRGLRVCVRARSPSERRDEQPRKCRATRHAASLTRPKPGTQRAHTSLARDRCAAQLCNRCAAKKAWARPCWKPPLLLATLASYLSRATATRCTSARGIYRARHIKKPNDCARSLT